MSFFNYSRILHLKNRLAAFGIALTTLIIFLTAYASAQSGYIPNLEIDIHPIPSGELPLDKMIKHKFEATNTGETKLEVDFFVEVIAPFQQEIRTVSPEPQTLFLEPGDTQVIMTKMDEKWGKIPAYLPGEVNEPGNDSRTYRWTFSESKTGQSQTIDVQIDYSLVDDSRHTNEAKRNDNISGPLEITASITNHQGVTLEDAYVKLTTGHWETVTNSDSTGQATFRGVPWREDWILEARSSEGSTICAPPPKQCNDIDPYWKGTPVARDMRFITQIDSDYNIQLNNPSWKSNYSLTNTMQNGIGFWKGAVDEAGTKILLVQGMENWIQSEGRESESKLFLYTTDGDLLWSYSMGWEAWGADLSGDGKWAAFVTSNPTKDLGVIDAVTGTPLWVKTAQDVTETTHPELDSKEVKISHSNEYLGIGGVDGTFLLADLITGKILWSKFLNGQVRGIVFDRADEYVYVGSGDGKAYKLDLHEGTLIWSGEIGSWPYVNGFQLSPDETTLAAGGKYGDLTLLNSATGETIWYHDMRDIVAWLDFSPDGKHLIAGGGGQYSTLLIDVETGEKIWQIPMYSFHGKFAESGDLILVDNYLFDLEGNEVGHLVLSEAGCVPGCQGLFAYISDDMTKIIQTRRDIDPTAISLYFIEGSVEATTPLPVSTIKSTTESTKDIPTQQTAEPQEPSNQVPMDMGVVECLLESMELKRALELLNKVPPPPNSFEIDVLAGCMRIQTEVPSLPGAPTDIDNNPFMNNDQNFVDCMSTALDEGRFEELRGHPPSIPTDAEMEIAIQCSTHSEMPNMAPPNRNEISMPPKDGNPFLSEDEYVVNCLVDIFGEERYKELRSGPPYIPTETEIMSVGRCFPSTGTLDKSQGKPLFPDPSPTKGDTRIDSIADEAVATQEPSTSSGGGCSSPIEGGKTPLGTIALLLGVVSIGSRKFFSLR